MKAFVLAAWLLFPAVSQAQNEDAYNGRKVWKKTKPVWWMLYQGN